jgi:hypothetical protein
MAKRMHEVDLPEVVREIVHDSGKLVAQQVELLRAEVGRELRSAADGAAAVAAGGGLSAAGGLLSGLMLAHLLNRVTGMPLWSCYGVVGGTVGAAGIALLRTGRSKLAGVDVLPPQTTAAVGENLAWLKEQLTPTAS